MLHATTLCAAGCCLFQDNRLTNGTFVCQRVHSARGRPCAAFRGTATGLPVLERRTFEPPPSLSQQAPAARPLTPRPEEPSFEDLYTQTGVILGKGCFATCYEVVEKATGRTYSAKQLPKSRPRQTAHQTRALINQEVAILRQLQKCPDVLQIHGVAESADYVYIITEVCRGGTLSDYLKRAGPMSEAQCAHAMRTILSAINACHRAGVEYGDLKPANVLLRQQPAEGEMLNLVLADYGCSQFVDSHGHAVSSPGTPLFAAPEVMFHRNGLEADLWSAGVLMYHMISGQWPFFGPDENLSPNSAMRRALSGPILWSSSAWEGVSNGAKRLIERMLDRDKCNRITAKEALSHPWITGLDAESYLE